MPHASCEAQRNLVLRQCNETVLAFVDESDRLRGRLRVSLHMRTDVIFINCSKECASGLAQATGIAVKENKIGQGSFAGIPDISLARVSASSTPHPQLDETMGKRRHSLGNNGV